MKKYLVLVFFAFSLSGLHSQSVRLVGDARPPFVDEAGGSPGFMVELVGLALEKEGLTWKYDMIPWTRAIAETKGGRAQIIVAIPNEQALAEGFILCPVPFGYYNTDFFTNKNSTWTFKNMDSLSTQRLGVIQDYSYTPELDAYIETNNTTARIEVSSGDNPMETNIKKLLANRFSVVVDDRLVILWRAKILGVESQLRHAGSLGKSIPASIAISPTYPKAKEFAERIGIRMKSLMGTPEFNKILTKYGVSPWKKIIRRFLIKCQAAKVKPFTGVRDFSLVLM